MGSDDPVISVKMASLESEVKGLTAQLNKMEGKLDTAIGQLSVLAVHEVRLLAVEKDSANLLVQTVENRRAIDKATGGWKVLAAVAAFGSSIISGLLTFLVTRMFSGK